MVRLDKVLKSWKEAPTSPLIIRFAMNGITAIASE